MLFKFIRDISEMIAVVDYDIGNISSVINMFLKIGKKCCATSNAEEIKKADYIILPGNGAYDSCMKNLRASGLIPIIEEQIFSRNVPLMGICVGAQMLGNCSSEGVEPGLGWIDMEVKRFPSTPSLRVPHMGWNSITTINSNHQLSKNTNGSRFYFVHSYYMVPKNTDEILFTSNYGIEFASAVAKKNIIGVQFHPEKSHRFGMQFFNDFIKSEL